MHRTRGLVWWVLALVAAPAMVVVLLLWQSQVAAAQDDGLLPETEEAVVATLDAIIAAWLANDVEALDALTSEDFVWIGATGDVTDREGWLSGASGEMFAFDSMTPGDLVLKQLSPTAVLASFPLDLVGSAQGMQFKAFEYDTALLEDTGDGWVVSFMQGTERAEDTAAYEEETTAMIGVALSALPATMAEGASVAMMDATTGASAFVKPGSSGIVCYGDSPLTEMVDPFCGDEALMTATFSVYAGETPEVDRLGVGYALQGFAIASATDLTAMQPAEGEEWIEFGPSLVFIAPAGFDAEQFSTDPTSGQPVVLFDGQPLEMLVVPVVPTTAEDAGDVDEAAATAMSAAPAGVAADSTIVTFGDDGSVEVLAEGTNSWICFPNDPTTPGGDPTCVDPQWSAFFDAYLAGEEPDVQGIGLAYMLQGGLTASNTDPMATEPAEGEEWVKDGPHIMLLLEGGLDESLYSTDHLAGGPYVMWAGTPYAHLMVPVAPFDESNMDDAEMEMEE